MNCLRTLLLTTVAGLTLASPAAARQDLVNDVPTETLPLALGGAQFWKAGTFDGGESASFKVAVAEGGKRLRVAYDTPSREDGFTVALLDPSGTSRASRAGSNVFNQEAFYTPANGETVAAGEWTVVLTAASSATQAAARLRIKLEKTVPVPGPGADGKPRPLLPNFKSVPPYEFGFA